MEPRSPSHQSCADSVEAQVREAILKIRGTIESIYPVTLDASENHDEELENGNPSTHRFQLTVTMPCQAESSSCSSSEDKCQELLYLDELFQTSEESPTQQLSPKASLINLMDTGIPHFGEQSSEDHHDHDIVFLELTDEELREMGAINADSNNIALYPLSTEELRETINEQLNKTLPPRVLNWSSTLFNDLTSNTSDTVKMDQQFELSDTSLDESMNRLGVSQQQQSNEISSSWDRLPSSTVPLSRPYCHSTAMLPQFTSQECFTNSNAAVAFAGIHKVNLEISSTQQQIMCPANLPAVSALVTGVGNNNNGGSSTHWATTSRTVQSLHARSGFRPSLLMPKTSVMPSVSAVLQKSMSPVPPKQRARKTSPLLEDRFTTPIDKSADIPIAAPNGRSYTSWILQESLVKGRQLQKEEKLKVKENKKVEKHGREGEKPSVQKIRKPKIYVCPVCGKSYGSANGIKYHAENAHGQKNIYTCEFCNKEYASRHGLAAHKKSHAIRAVAQDLEMQRLKRNN